MPAIAQTRGLLLVVHTRNAAAKVQQMEEQAPLGHAGSMQPDSSPYVAPREPTPPPCSQVLLSFPEFFSPRYVL